MAAAKDFGIEPRQTRVIETPYRRIRTAIPHPDSLATLRTLRECESRSMRGQPPVVWGKTHGFQVEDAYGNMWVDWSSGVLVANAGHNHPRIVTALQDYIASGAPLMTYCFPSEARAKLVEKLIHITPKELDRVFLLTTGAESVEVAIKLARTHGARLNPKKRYVISYEGGFHGRTYGAQLAGAPMEWVDPNRYFVQMPFPGSIDTDDKRFDMFANRLKEMSIAPGDVAGVIAETFQGREAKLMPVEYAQALRAWCSEHKAALIFDEVQAGFGRTGRLFAFEHYGVVPDLVCCGKGITSSLPLSAVVGRAEYMDQFGPGEMTSTHTGSPLPAVAALASIEAILGDKLIENAAELGPYLKAKLVNIARPYHDQIEVGGVGLVMAMVFFNNREERKPDPDKAFQFCEESLLGGNLFFAPVGKGYGAIKFCPPLCITKPAIDDALYGPAGIKDTLTKVMS
ncbi:MAG: aspartate aminotransferase family protein [Candidatus Sumerlaeota bacterium]|nr:aspartate aminotransferase family protein [Candidatus Sumerlaeota bacterium]